MATNSSGILVLGLMKILIIAPDSDLNTHVDLIAAMGGNTATSLHGIVPVREVLNAIASGQYDAIHFASHGEKDALLMSDGMIDEEQLETAIKRSADTGSQIKMVFLNACQSITAGIYIHSPREGSPSFVIGWRTDVKDEVAGAFAVRFYQALSANGEDVHDAFDSGVYAVRRTYPDAEIPLLLNGRIQDLRIAMNDMIVRFSSLEKELQKERTQTRIVPIWMFIVFLLVAFVPPSVFFYIIWTMLR